MESQISCRPCVAVAVLIVAVELTFLVTLSTDAAAQQVVPLLNEPHHHFVLENEYVRVFSFDLPAQTQTETYGSSNDLIVLALTDSELTELRLGQDPKVLKFKKGEPQSFTDGHEFSLRNQKDSTFQAMVVEVLLAPPPPPDCGCKPSGPGAGCGRGSGGGSVADGGGYWIHGNKVGQIGIYTYGLQPVATSIARNRSEPLPELLVKAGDHGKLLIAIDDLEYRSGSSDPARFSLLAQGETLWVERETWISFPQPANCTWDNFQVDGKVRPTCLTSVFVTLEPRPEATSRK
jgi:hypothetical protein